MYAIENLVTGLLFGIRHDDFDFMVYTDENGGPVLCECYPNAFEGVHRGKSCSVYELDDKDLMA